jgi:hypothetical protein
MEYFLIARNFGAGLTRAILYLGAVGTSGCSIDGDAGGASQRWGVVKFDDVDDALLPDSFFSRYVFHQLARRGERSTRMEFPAMPKGARRGLR